MQSILALLQSHLPESFAGQLTAGFFGASVIAWFLGKLSGFSWYKNLRSAYGKTLRAFGAFIDTTLGSKFGRPIWNPLEKIFLDWLGFGFEQFCEGLRANDLVAMAEQHERLEGVGSDVRKRAIAAQMEAAIADLEKLPKAPTPALQKVLETSYAAALQKKLAE